MTDLERVTIDSCEQQMALIKKCPKCGSEIPPDARRGLCPSCLLGIGNQPPLETPTQAENSAGVQGRRFADYELGEPIGEGGMGVVYKAVQVSLRRSVALKMIRDAKAHSPEARRRFAIEAEAAAKLDHPGIVPIYAVGEHEEQPFLSMRFIAGENLREKIARGELCVGGPNRDQTAAGLRSREANVAALVAAVARAIQHAHDHGVLHRDLKPGNIIVDGDGQPHLTDFGLAKILDQAKSDGLTGPDNILGTPAYMSPEQASGQRVNAASDIYSLGAVFYEMLTGQPAFKGATPLETMRMVAEKDARRPSTLHHRVDRDLETICLKCLEKNPASRYASAGELADDLDRWSRREPINARSVGPALRLTRWVRRNPVGAALIVSLFIGLTAVSMLLKQSLDAKREKVDQVLGVQQSILGEVQRLWDSPKQSYVHIDAAQLAILADLPAPSSSGALRLIFAKRITQSPDKEAIAFAPVLGLIGERITVQLRRPVVFDLRFYKLSGGAVQWPVAQGEVDFQRMGPVAYLRAEQAGMGLAPVVHEQSSKHGVIFARSDASITNLDQVEGRRIAFGHTNSVLSCVAKLYLITNGLLASRLGFFENIERMDAPRPQEAEADFEYHAHKHVIRKVLAGEFDVGVAQRKHFEANRNKGRGLVELGSFIVPPDVYVARPGLATNLIAAFREALVSLQSKRERELVEKLESPRITGFVTISGGYFDDLRFALTNLVTQFDIAPASSPAAAPSPPR
jgi:serine/threonine protein kinase/ABC-type phosphate/phosphonate transport system substrate-binding protein